MLMRNWSTLSWIPTQSLKRLSGRRPASPQTETSSLPLTIVPVAWKCCSSLFDVDIRKTLYANVVLSHRELCCSWCRLRHRAQIYGGNDKQKNLRAPKRKHHHHAPNVAVARKCCSRQFNVDIRKNLHATVVLSGGTTIFQGICEHIMLHSRCFFKIVDLAGRVR